MKGRLLKKLCGRLSSSCSFVDSVEVVSSSDSVRVVDVVSVVARVDVIGPRLLDEIKSLGLVQVDKSGEMYWRSDSACLLSEIVGSWLRTGGR